MADRVRGDDVFALSDELAARIRAGLGFGESGEVRRTADVSSPSLAAFREFSHGMDALAELQWASAEASLNEAIALDPAFAEAYLRLAFVYRATGRMAVSHEALEQAAAHAERLSERYRLLLDIELALANGDPRREADVLDELIRRYPDTLEAYSHVARLYSPSSGAFPDVDKLLDITRRGAAALPSAKQARLAYGYALVDAGRFVEALGEFQAYARLAPNEPNPYDSLGDIYLHLGQPQEATGSYSRAIAIDPNFGSSNGLAYALGTLGKYDEALAAEPSLVHVRALLLSRVGRYHDAYEVLAAGIADATARESPLGAAGLALLSGWLALERSDLESARDRAREALERYSQQPEGGVVGSAAAEVLLGIAESRAGDLDDARERLRRLDQEPGGQESRQWWVEALRAEIALEEGGASLETDQPWAPPRPYLVMPSAGSLAWNNFGLRDVAARAALARGNLAVAIETYEARLTPSAEQKWIGLHEPRYVLAIARALLRSGQEDAARNHYERFLGLWKDADPDLPELEEARRAVARTR